MTFVTIVTKEIFSGSFDGRLALENVSVHTSLFYSDYEVGKSLLKHFWRVCFGVWYFSSWPDTFSYIPGTTYLVNFCNLQIESSIQ